MFVNQKLISSDIFPLLVEAKNIFFLNINQNKIKINPENLSFRTVKFLFKPNIHFITYSFGASIVLKKEYVVDVSCAV